MRVEWHIDSRDINAIKSIVASQQRRTFVINRIKRNVNGKVPRIDDDEIWKTLVMCLLTSRQQSGPHKPVSKFLGERPFRLSLRTCRRKSDLMSFVSSTLSDFGGIRFGETIAKRVVTNLDALESGGWKELWNFANLLKSQRQQRPDPSHFDIERRAARYMDRYKGFGPKQSRNFWQSLGLTRYEFVLDARITKWLKKARFPLPLSGMALADEEYYVFLSDILRKLCRRAGVLPCVLDAAIFASYDEQEWQPYNDF